MANNDIGDAQHAIEFCNLSGIGMEVDESVNTVGQTIDLVSEFTLAPLIDVVDRALTVRDGGLDAIHSVGAGLFVSRRSNEKQQFVSLHQLTSFGLNGPGLVKAHTGAGISPDILAAFSPLPSSFFSTTHLLTDSTQTISKRAAHSSCSETMRLNRASHPIPPILHMDCVSRISLCAPMAIILHTKKPLHRN